MKRLLNLLGFSARVFFIALLFLTASSFAELESKSDSAARAVSDLQSALSSAYDYCDVYYFEEMDRIMVRVGADGLADIVVAMIDAGVDESYEPWADYRANVISMYDNLMEVIHTKYRRDLTLSFHLVNDDIYIRDDRSRLSSQDFISINGGTGSVFDIIKFHHTMNKK